MKRVGQVVMAFITREKPSHLSDRTKFYRQFFYNNKYFQREKLILLLCFFKVNTIKGKGYYDLKKNKTKKTHFFGPKISSGIQDTAKSNLQSTLC